MKILSAKSECKSFQPLTFWVIFFHFFQRIQTEHQILRLLYIYQIVEKLLFFVHLFANFKAKIGQNGSK
jgi:hypothetical protein